MKDVQGVKGMTGMGGMEGMNNVKGVESMVCVKGMGGGWVCDGKGSRKVCRVMDIEKGRDRRRRKGG